MSTERAIGDGAAAGHARLYRSAGSCALAVGAGYVVILVLYIWTGAPPSGGAAWLTYAAGKSVQWWGILALSVATDLLYLPVAAALYQTLKDAGRYAASVAAGLLGLFVGLDLAVTWPNYASLIALADRYAAATADGRAVYVAAAEYATAVLSGRLEAVYSIGVPSVGILIAGLVMRRGPFSRTLAAVGVTTGLLGLVAVLGPIITSALGVFVILVSAFTTGWFILLGRELHTLARTRRAADP